MQPQVLGMGKSGSQMPSSKREFYLTEAGPQEYSSNAFHCQWPKMLQEALGQRMEVQVEAMAGQEEGKAPLAAWLWAQQNQCLASAWQIVALHSPVKGPLCLQSGKRNRANSHWGLPAGVEEDREGPWENAHTTSWME